MKFLVCVLLIACRATFAAEVQLPPRPTKAPSGSAIARRIADLDLAAREKEIKTEILNGNVPVFWRKFVSVSITNESHSVQIFVAPDYLAVGSDADYFLTPLSPRVAQEIADRLDCTLPTTKMVDEIYRAASVKLEPAPIPPSSAMTTAPVFAEHNENVRRQRSENAAALGSLVAGHKKDVVITKRLMDAPGKVAIYGWHKPGQKPIQPLYLGHTENWVDYSHGIRLIARKVALDGQPATIDSALADPKLSALLSDEGPIINVRYRSSNALEEIRIDPGVRIVIDQIKSAQTNTPVRLILYALPNGNTIEQTMGRKLNPGEDWHFDIQHIRAQTDFLRVRLTNINLIVCYLECAEKAWPAWRRAHDPENSRIPALVDSLRARFAGRQTRIILTGHSGGGSFTFGYLNGIQEIPNDIERIAFLDSNYAYDAKLAHAEKLARWLKASDQHFLCVLAYNDAVALLNGQSFVSESGGTWGRSHAMLHDLGEPFSFARTNDSDWERVRALDGRIVFLLKENPTRAIFHTKQVELNGFIHAMLTGTELQDKGYTYFGERAYSDLIKDSPAN